MNKDKYSRETKVLNLMFSISNYAHGDLQRCIGEKRFIRYSEINKLRDEILSGEWDSYLEGFEEN